MSFVCRTDGGGEGGGGGGGWICSLMKMAGFVRWIGSLNEARGRSYAVNGE